MEVGDVVMLRSGGPPMTVIGIKDGVAECVHFGTRIDVSEERRAPEVRLSIGPDMLTAPFPFAALRKMDKVELDIWFSRWQGG